MPEVLFAEADSEKIIAEMSAEYEKVFKEATGESIVLRPADTARLMIATAAFAVTHIEALVDHAAKMNLVQYAEEKYLDALTYGVTDPRKDAVPAYTTVKIYFSTALAAPQTIPKGTRVTAGDGIYWATETDVIAPVSATEATVRCICQTPGAIGNGYTAGAIKTLVDTSKIRFFASLENVDTSSGGADPESDADLRERIRTTPESFSTAGPEGAYIHLLKAYDANIADACTVSPSPGVVANYIVMKDGYVPSEEYLAGAKAHMSQKTKRPMTDNVLVQSPDGIDYEVDATYYIRAEDAALEADIRARVENAVEEYILWQRSRIGRGIDPSELVCRMKNAGASRVSVTAPVYTELTRGEYDEDAQALKPVQIARNVQKTVRFGGVTNG